jgi:hypothetical protein
VTITFALITAPGESSGIGIPAWQLLVLVVCLVAFSVVLFLALIAAAVRGSDDLRRFVDSIAEEEKPVEGSNGTDSASVTPEEEEEPDEGTADEKAAP